MTSDSSVFLKEVDFIYIFWCTFILSLYIRPIKTETIFTGRTWKHLVSSDSAKDGSAL